MTQPDQSVISANNLVFNYGKLKVLQDLSLHVARGEIFGLLGANGAGKTTFMRLLLGFIKPQVGDILVFDEPPSPRVSRRIGYMPQLNALYLELSVQQNLDFFSRMYGLSNRSQRRKAVETALNLVALWDRRKDPILRLSGGMRQRVSLAIALVHTPPLLVLDEPTVGLDPELRSGFWDYFRKAANEGTTLVLSSHTMDDAAHCDRLAFIQEGRVVAQGSPTELRAAAGAEDASLEDAFLYFVRRK